MQVTPKPTFIENEILMKQETWEDTKGKTQTNALIILYDKEDKDVVFKVIKQYLEKKTKTKLESSASSNTKPDWKTIIFIELMKPTIELSQPWNGIL